MKNKKKIFSIVTPTLNSKKFISKTIHSIHRQTFKNFEHIIVDGRSTDGTLKILRELKKKYKFKLIIKKDRTMYEALKTGFNKCSGQYFYWLNSDDYFLNKHVLFNLNNLLKKKKYQWINGRTAIFFENKKKLMKWLPLVYPRLIIKNGFCHKFGWGFIQQENVVFSSKLYKKAGGINTHFKIVGDYDLWIRFSKFENLVPVNIEIAAHRKWDRQQSNNLQKIYIELKKKMKFINFLYPFRFIYSIIMFPLVFFRK